MTDLFIELIQVSLGNRVRLSYIPSQYEWASLYNFAQSQSLVGIAFEGINKLSNSDPESIATLSPVLKLQWLGNSEIIRQNNQALNKRCCELYSKILKDGYESCILKGPGISALYPVELRDLRATGDIDIWIKGNREAVVKYAKSQFGFNGLDFKHLHTILYNDVPVELHYLPCVFRNPFYNKRLAEFINRASKFDYLVLDEYRIAIPNIEFNIVYILQHIFSHLFAEETNSKQYVDYYFVLHSFARIAGNRDKAYHTICKLGMRKFCCGVMWILVNYLGMSEDLVIGEIDEKEGRFLLGRLLSNSPSQHQYKSYKTPFFRKVVVLLRQTSKNFQLFTHYPFEVIWSPIWLVRHYLWKKWWYFKHRDILD